MAPPKPIAEEAAAKPAPAAPTSPPATTKPTSTARSSERAVGRDDARARLNPGRRPRPSAQRLLVLDALRRTTKAISAQELYERLRAIQPSIGRATVLRNLEALVNAGLAQRFERQGHSFAYAGCSATHHHHLICLECNATQEIDEDVVEPLIERLRGRYGFWIRHNALDFFGTCASCAVTGSGRRSDNPARRQIVFAS